MKILFISNGHGEDLNGSQVLAALRHQQPEVKLAAMPIVGAGNSYRKLDVEIIGPTETLPSGGFIYMDRWKFVEDLRSGLLTLLWRQIGAILAHSRDCAAIFATGDVVVLAIAYLTGKPYSTFIVSTSAYYEGRMRLPLLTNWLLRHQRCRQVFTRDRFTAEDLQRQGIKSALFVGYPIMDVLQPTGKDLHLASNVPMVALLPGSRLPEAEYNLALLMALAIETKLVFEDRPIQFYLAATPNLLTPDATGISPIERVARERDWQYNRETQILDRDGVRISCHSDAFADILTQSSIVVGMAGTAIEQAVGLGKPVIQIPGGGPQFTYRFAEAQMRLLGKGVQTIGTDKATRTEINAAARAIDRTLTDRDYLATCAAEGLERVGTAGGAAAMAESFWSSLIKC